ncbi:MAG TPA: DNA primase, partial [Arenimonas sp.]
RGGRSGAPAPRRSLVRTAIALLLQKPMLSEVIQPPYRFAVLRQPGIPLLVELLELVRDRPGITTGAVLEHFAGREEEPALQKLALQGFPGEESAWGHELVDALVQLDRQVNQQRIDELQARIREVGMSGLSDIEKTELRELHAIPR